MCGYKEHSVSRTVNSPGPSLEMIKKNFPCPSIIPLFYPVFSVAQIYANVIFFMLSPLLRKHLLLTTFYGHISLNNVQLTKIRRITWHRLAIQKKLATSSIICVWTFKKAPRVIWIDLKLNTNISDKYDIRDRNPTFY